MSEREKEILEIIKSFIEEKGYSPTVREICRLANFKSTSSVHAYIKRLKANGHLTSGVDMARSIVVINKEKRFKFVVNGIALMYKGDKEYILLQEKKKGKANINMLELPGGIIMGSENVYGCLRREFRAKGFEVTKIFGEDKCNELSKEDEELTIFKPFCISQHIEGNESIISNTILCKVDEGTIEEVSNKLRFKYVCTDDLRTMLVDYQENISAHNIAALKLFCNL